MSTARVYSHYCPTRIHLGIEAHRQLAAIVRRDRIERLFLAADPAVVQGEFFAAVLSLLRGEAVETTLFSRIEPDPSADMVEQAHSLFRSSGASAVLAVGGGSTIDVAKAVAILATNGGRIHDYEGIEKFSTPPLPLLAIPTTAGTGSEVSGSCVITDNERGLKMSIRHASLNPAREAILDPLALTSLPAPAAAHAALDAFVHAFESYLSLNAHPLTDALNLHAMELIGRHVRPFVADRGNLEAGLQMLSASTLAGITFGQTGLGNVHCMARFVGALTHSSHGLSNAICLPTVAEFNLPANPAKYARVAQALGEQIGNLSEDQAAQRAVQAIRAMCADLQVPARLRDVGLTADSLPEMARLCVEADYNRWNPRWTSYEDFIELFQRAL